MRPSHGQTFHNPTDPKLVQAAKDDFKKQTAGRSYYTAIPPDQKPPLNYRSE